MYDKTKRREELKQDIRDGRRVLEVDAVDGYRVLDVEFECSLTSLTMAQVPPVFLRDRALAAAGVRGLLERHPELIRSVAVRHCGGHSLSAPVLPPVQALALSGMLQFTARIWVCAGILAETVAAWERELAALSVREFKAGDLVEFETGDGPVRGLVVDVPPARITVEVRSAQAKLSFMCLKSSLTYLGSIHDLEPAREA